MDGIIIVNKPKEYTSNDVVCKIKNILKEKVGHTGTLDPNATGVLPLLIGKGTLLSKYLINHDKKYEAVLKLGQKTDTADIEGKIVQEKYVDKSKLSKENLKFIFQTLIGEQEQLPPIYSAIKINGKKLYEYARNGKEINIKPRKINIYSLEPIDINTKENKIILNIECSKGTYIRTICETIAEKLNTVGYMEDLKRLKVGNFKIEDSTTIENIKNKNYNIITIEDFFKDKEKIILKEKGLHFFINGVQLTYNMKSDIYKIYSEQNKFIGTGIIKNNLLKRDIIL